MDFATIRLAFLLLVLIAVVGVVCATPVLDGDLFWHMAYAKQMLRKGTLILDHTEFSWTPTSNRMIYCAWLAELFYYGIWKWLGPWGVFAFRYVGLFVLLFLIL